MKKKINSKNFLTMKKKLVLAGDLGKFTLLVYKKVL